MGEWKGNIMTNIAQRTCSEYLNFPADILHVIIRGSLNKHQTNDLTTLGDILWKSLGLFFYKCDGAQNSFLMTSISSTSIHNNNTNKNTLLMCLVYILRTLVQFLTSIGLFIVQNGAYSCSIDTLVR